MRHALKPTWIAFVVTMALWPATATRSQTTTEAPNRPFGARSQLAHGAWFSPLDLEFELVRELWRRGHLREGHAGDTAYLSEPNLPVGRDRLWLDPAAFATGPGAQLRRWLAYGARETTVGFALQPEVWVETHGTDPHLQMQPRYADIGEHDQVDDGVRARAALRLDAAVNETLSGHFRFAFDTDGRNNPLNRTRQFEQLDSSNNVDEAYVRWAGRTWGVVLGRAPLQWGPERLGSLILSSTAPYLDMLHGHVQLDRHQIQAFAAQLSSEGVAAADTLNTLDPGVTQHRRFLYGHRLDLWFGAQNSTRLRVGLSETALVAGPGEGLNLLYLNPIQFYAQAQTEQDGGASVQVNVMNSLDFDAFLGHSGVHLYGSFLVDDLQIAEEGRKNNPDQLGWTLGADWSPSARSPWLLGVESRRVGSWTYLHRGDATDYRHFFRPLGAPEGPDTDLHNVRVGYRNGHGWSMALEVERLRRGENRITSLASRMGNAGRPFPLGNVEVRNIARMTVEVDLAPYAKAALQAAFHDVSDLNNSQRSEDVVEIRFAVTLRGPTLEWARSEPID